MSVNATTLSLPTTTATQPATVPSTAPTSAPANANANAAATTPTTDQSTLNNGTSSTATLPASTATQSVQGEKASSVGDPHETTADGTKFDNERTGEFVKAQSQSGDFVLQTRQDHPIQNSNVTINTAAAVKLGPDVVNYDAKTRTLTVNGQATTLSDGQTTQLPGGGSVALNKDTYTLTSPKGDQVTLQDVGGGLNVGLTLGNRTAGEVKGELGNFDGAGQGGQELVGRDGTTYDAKDQTQLGKYLDDWTVKSGESLFDGERAANQTAGGATNTTGGTGPTDGSNAPNGGTGSTDGTNTANNPAQPQDPQQLLGQLEQLMQNFIQEFNTLLGQQAPAAPTAPTAPAPAGGAADTTAPTTAPATATAPTDATAPTAPTAPAPTVTPQAQPSSGGGLDLSSLSGLFSQFSQLFENLLKNLK